VTADSVAREGTTRAPAMAIGVFGGTFDPIHVAHLAVAEAARDALGLERVLFVPNRQPPHKPDRPVSPAADRLAMVRAAIADNPAFEVSTLEVDRDGPSYTADTLEALRMGRLAAGEPGDLALILSVDALAGLGTWHDPARVLALAQLVVAPRDGYPNPTPEAIARLVPGAEARIVVLDGPRMRLSASEIRARAAAGRSLRYLVPDAVAAYIGDHGLYTQPRRIDRS
jgi:nicotinate-nucleotide adenylyltransferase